MRVNANTAEISHLLSASEYVGQRRMPVLDGLRGIAVAMVVTCHLHNHMWTGLSGYVGVTIFFVLSGYLITRLALVEEAREGRLNLQAFFLRRCFRIFPLYFFFLGMYCLLLLKVKLWPAKIAPFHANLPYYLFYFQEIPFFRSHATSLGPPPFYHTWSLGIEEKFYLVWPFVFVLAAAAASRTRLRAIIVAAAMLVCVVQGTLVENTSTYDLQSYGFILMGILLALTLNHERLYQPTQRLLRRSAVGSVLIMLLVQLYLMPYHMHRGLSSIYALAATVLLGYVVTSRGRITRFLSAPPLTFLGRLSYGIYLCHILILGFVEKFAKPDAGRVVGIAAYLGTLAASVAVSLVTYRTLEGPLIQVGHRWSKYLIGRPTHSNMPAFQQQNAVSLQNQEQL